MRSILVVGGAGYIGSHTVVELENNGLNTIILDNFSNSSIKAIDRIGQICGKEIKYYNIDARDYNLVKEVFEENEIDSVINLAGYKAVGESVQLPYKYYDNNLNIALNLIRIMNEMNIKKMLFSSTATVYSQYGKIPFCEDNELAQTNPYARTKYMIEKILEDMCKSDKEWKAVSLRYFNPLGAHESGLIGEDPNGIPNNLAPYITQVAIGKLPILNVFGDDYDTKDGTCIRDYVHVCDLAIGHRMALDLFDENDIGFEYINLGSGIGYSVFDIIKSFEKVIGKEINYKITGRRAGDIPVAYAKIDKAKDVLNWEPTYSIEDMCASAWNWQKNNPNGFR